MVLYEMERMVIIVLVTIILGMKKELLFDGHPTFFHFIYERINEIAYSIFTLCFALSKNLIHIFCHFPKLLNFSPHNVGTLAAL